MKFSNRDARFRIDFRVTENADARATRTGGLSWWEGARERDRGRQRRRRRRRGGGGGGLAESMRAARMIMEKLRTGKSGRTEMSIGANGHTDNHGRDHRIVRYVPQFSVLSHSPRTLITLEAYPRAFNIDTRVPGGGWRAWRGIGDRRACEGRGGARRARARHEIRSGVNGKFHGKFMTFHGGE